MKKLSAWYKLKIEQFRNYRTNKFMEVGKFFLKLKISANVMTFFALILGLGAIYYLFDNTLYFIVLGILHLIADALDGVIARASKETTFGHYFDHISDRTITLLAMIKIWYFLNDYYVLIIIGMFLITQIIHLSTKFKAPAYFSRTITLIVLAFNLPILAYLLTGIASLFSLISQFVYFLHKQ